MPTLQVPHDLRSLAGGVEVSSVSLGVILSATEGKNFDRKMSHGYASAGTLAFPRLGWSVLCPSLLFSEGRGLPDVSLSATSGRKPLQSHTVQGL